MVSLLRNTLRHSDTPADLYDWVCVCVRGEWDHNIKNSRKKWRKCISVTGNLRGQAQVRPIDKLDEACTNVDDQMKPVQRRSGDRVLS